MKKAIYLIIEMQKRELDAKILLGMKAVNKGYEVVICKKSRLYEKIHLIKPGIFFLKSFGKNYEKILDKINLYGHKITGLDEEGLQIFDNSWIVGKRFSKKILNYIKLIFSWGLESKSIYETFFKKKKKDLKIISTGHPKMELLNKNILKYYNEDVNKIKKNFGNFILVATQFPRFNTDGVNIFKKSYTFKNTFKNIKSHHERLNKKCNYQQERNFYEFNNMYSYLSKEFPKKNILIRVHPAENHDTYKKIIKNSYSNIKVLKSDDNIIPYIIASDVLIGCNCTTSIESFLMNKISINYIPYKDSQFEFTLTNLVSINVRNLKILKKIIKNKIYKKKNIIPKTNFNKAKKILGNLIDKNCSDNIIKNIKLINVNSTNQDNKRQNIINYIYFWLLVKLKNLYYFLFLRSSLNYRIQVNKRKSLNRMVIQKKVDNFSKVLFGSKKFIVKEKYYGLFYIERL